jgi:hypothetical protein
MHSSTEKKDGDRVAPNTYLAPKRATPPRVGPEAASVELSTRSTRRRNRTHRPPANSPARPH